VNIAMLLEMAAEGDPGRVVVGSHDGGLTAAELLGRAQRAAIYMEMSGAGHIGYFGLNSEVMPVSLFGAALAGIPFSPVNYRAPDEQLRGIIGRMGAGLMIADDDEVERLRACGAAHVITKGEFAAVISEPLEGEHRFVDPEEVAVLLFTSGTTSEPKAAVLRHRHLVSYIISTVEFLGCGPNESQLICVPPYHIAGIAAVLSSLYAGRRIIYLPAFDPDEWVRTAVDEKVTHAMVVPTMLGRILQSIEDAGAELNDLRHLSYGGGRMPLELVERTLRDLPEVDLVNAYGLTETSSTIAMLTPDDNREAFASPDPSVRARLGSVGRPLPSLEVEVRGENEVALPSGEKGEIWVRGEQVAGEYVGLSLLTDDGWFRTRDAGWFDESGFLYVDGRLDDVIVRGAENISPGEVEEVLGAHPAVAEAAVIGIPDPEWGEAVAAVIVLRPGGGATEGELQEWVRQRLRSTRMPCVVQFRAELPYSATGKLLRRVLREEMTAGAENGPRE
jgi:acyl-CoA synthetase (AMP-forming)/AMP-acid ligase II